MNNKLEGNFNKGVSFIVFFSMLAQACSAQIPTEVSPTFNPQSTEVGGERAEDVNVTDLLAVKQEMTQEETESFNSKLQDPEKEVVTYDPLGNNLYTPREILTESRKEAVFLSVEKWVMGESERVFGHTVIDGENMIITESGDRLVALVEVDLVMGQDLSARGFARIGDDGVTLVPEILFGSDNKPYINDGSANFYRLSEDSKILETIDVGELSKEYGGGTLMRNSRMRFKNGVEFVVTPEGTLVSTESLTLNEATGKWEPAVPTAEEVAIALFDKYSVDPATYTLTDVDGIIVGTDKETGTEIFRDGKFEISYAVEIAKKDCEPTDFEPNQYGLLQDKDLDSFGEYFAKLLGDTNDNNFLSDNMLFSDVLVDRAKQCWAITNGDAFLYRVETNRVSVIPIIHLTKDEVIAFSFGRE